MANNSPPSGSPQSVDLDFLRRPSAVLESQFEVGAARELCAARACIKLKSVDAMYQTANVLAVQVTVVHGTNSHLGLVVGPIGMQ